MTAFFQHVGEAGGLRDFPRTIGTVKDGLRHFEFADLELQQSLAAVPKNGKIGEALRYELNHWNSLTRFLDDGRIEIDSNTVERSIRGLALNRKNALFAGHGLVFRAHPLRE